jgi:hypothetical protein
LNKLQLLVDNPTQIWLLRFLKMTLNKFCIEPTILTNETYINFQKFITTRILIGKNESRLIGKVMKISTTLFQNDFPNSTSKFL